MDGTYCNNDVPVCTPVGTVTTEDINGPSTALNMWLWRILLDVGSGFKETKAVNMETPNCALSHISMIIPKA